MGLLGSAAGVVGKSLAEIIKAANSAGVKLDVFEGKKGLELSKIVVPEKSKGVGSSIMKELSDYADSTGQAITLSPSTDFGGSSKKRLTDFYKRFGFVQNKGKNKDFTVSNSMYRNPEVKSNPAAGVGAAGLGLLAMGASDDSEAGVLGKLFHASPFKFDNFDYSKVGTGHGQRFGHGLYLSDDMPTAAQYKVANDANLVGLEINGVPANSMNLDTESKNYLKMIERYGNVDNAISKHGDLLAKSIENNSPARAEIYQETLDGLAQFKGADVKRVASQYDGRGIEGHFGHGYKVSSKSDSDKFLDWDKKIIDQSSYIQNALLPNKDSLSLATGKSYNDMTGKDVYYGISPKSTTTKEASSKLKDLGINGNKYNNDYDFRTNPDVESNNYVFFDDKDLNVTNKFSNPAAGAGAGVLGAIGASQSNKTYADYSPANLARLRNNDVGSIQAPQSMAASNIAGLMGSANKVGYNDSLLGMVAPQLPSELMNKIAYNDRRGLMDYAKAYAGLLGF